MDNLYQLLAQKMDNLPQKHDKFCKYPLKAAPQMRRQNKRPFDFVNKPTIITLFFIMVWIKLPRYLHFLSKMDL